MGVQFDKLVTDPATFQEFKRRLRKETAILAKWFSEAAFQNEGKSTGLEVEFWLVDDNFLPAPRNAEYLATANDGHIVTETGKFNAELNTDPIALTPSVLRDSRRELARLWTHASVSAEKLGMHVLSIGSLPTVRDTDLCLENLSNMERYRALNSQILHLRNGRKLHLDIEGRDRLDRHCDDIMFESTATSLQCHFQIEADKSAPYFNASLLCTIPLVAVAANSPYLLGNDLWDETRVPIFEQTMRLPGFSDWTGTPVGRVGLGSGYLRESLLECFLENLDGYPILLPILMEEEPEWLAHIRLHNGCIWRWSRPILGLSRSGQPHLRIEQRTPASGPTVDDMIANQAFFLGFTHWVAMNAADYWKDYSFESLKTAFYAAARDGLFAQVPWIDGKTHDLQSLFAATLVPQARQGLYDLGVDRNDADHYLDIILGRARAGRTGAAWQRAYVSVHGKDFQGLVESYFKNQESGKPVHEWSV